MAKKKRRKIDSAGWGFFVIASAVLMGPIMYLSWLYRSPLAEPGAPIVTGGLLALAAAGFVTWIANMVLQSISARKRDAAKAAKQNKK